jgi:hypothetical protein
LLQNAQVRAVLYQQTDSGHEVGDTVTLGGIQYGPNWAYDPSYFLTGSSGWQTFSITPGAGSYQLLFGSFDTNAPGIATALAISSVRVPESTTEGILALAATILFCVAWNGVWATFRTDRAESNYCARVW